jgi:hypothetical protein
MPGREVISRCRVRSLATAFSDNHGAAQRQS